MEGFFRIHVNTNSQEVIDVIKKEIDSKIKLGNHKLTLEEDYQKFPNTIMLNYLIEECNFSIEDIHQSLLKLVDTWSSEKKSETSLSYVWNNEGEKKNNIHEEIIWMSFDFS